MSALKQWPGKGDKMVFLDCNGYDHEREEAAKVMRKGDVLTVADIEIGGWSSAIQFDEFPGQRFNSVMFDFYESRTASPAPSTDGVDVVPVAWRYRVLNDHDEWTAWSISQTDPHDWLWPDDWQDIEVEPLVPAASLDQATRRAEEARKWAYEQRLTKHRSGCACHISDDDKLVNVCNFHKEYAAEAAESRCSALEQALDGIHYWSLVIESAVRNADPANRDGVMQAIHAAREARSSTASSITEKKADE